MKKSGQTIVSGLIFLFLFTNLFAQPRKASVMVGSSYGLTGKKIESGDGESALADKKDELLSLGFTPRVGYHLSDHTLAGVSIKYGKKLLDGGEGKLDLFTVGPFVRYYLIHRKIAPYLEIEAGTGSYNESGVVAATHKSKVYYFSGGGGVEFFFSPAFSFDMGVNFKKTSEHPVLSAEFNNETFRNMNFRAGLSLHLFWKNELKRSSTSKNRYSR